MVHLDIKIPHLQIAILRWGILRFTWKGVVEKQPVCQHISGSDGEVVAVIQVAADSAAANVIDLKIVATYD